MPDDPPEPRKLPPQSAYFEKPAIETGADEVLLFCTLKNEAMRLPYFLDHYRAMGIRHFFVIDNASTDGSGEILARQPDVHLFHTDLSYKGSSAGRLWMQELCEHYGMNRWCLTVDVDELLVFPGCELLTIPQLTTYLDVEGVKGLFTVFLDMYSDRPLSETIYEPGAPFLDVCPFYETESYLLKPGANPPFLSVFGGPRGKSFLAGKGGNMGPMMKKVPLVKWEQGFSYIFSTHSHSHVPLSAVTGALLHFKFFDFFTDLAAYEAQRGDRRQPKDYAHYAITMTEDVCFFGPDSRRYRSSADLVEQGVTVAPSDFRDFCLSAAREQGPARERDMRRLLKPQQIDHGAAEVGRLTLRAMPMIWPFVNNHAQAEYFSDGIVARKFTSRRRFVDRAREVVRIMDTDDTGMLVHIPEAMVYRNAHPRLTLLCFREGRLAWKTGLPDDGARLRVAEGSLESSTYRIDCDFAAMAGPGDTVLRDLAFYLAADEAMPEDGYADRPLRVHEHLRWAHRLLRVPRMAVGASTVPEGLQRVRMDGVVRAGQ